MKPNLKRSRGKVKQMIRDFPFSSLGPVTPVSKVIYYISNFTSPHPNLILGQI